MSCSEGTLPRNWEKSYCIFCGRSQTFRRPQDLQYGHNGFFWPQQLAEKWVTLQRDEATNGFLKRCLAGPTFWEVCKLAPFRVLRWFISATDANAILKRGDAQFNYLCSACVTASAQFLLGHRYPSTSEVGQLLAT